MSSVPPNSCENIQPPLLIATRTIGMVREAVAIMVPALVGAGLALLSRRHAGKQEHKAHSKSRILKHFHPVPQLLEGKAEVSVLSSCVTLGRARIHVPL